MPRPRTVRRIVVLLSVVLLPALVAACAPTPPPGAKPAAPASSAAQPAAQAAQPTQAAQPDQQPQAAQQAQAAKPAPAAQPDRPLVISLSSEPTNLNPIFLDMNAGNWKVFSGLLKYDKDLNLVPDLAAAMPTVGDDGRTVTVKLRDGVKFHDGQPLTARDVVFTYQAMLDPKVATRVRAALDLGSIREIKAVDDLTVQFSLARMDPAFLHKLYIGVTPQHLLEGKDLNTIEFNRAPIGSGPYVFKEWRAGDRLIFEANPAYYGGEPAIKRLVYTWAPSDNARSALLTNGTVDTARLTARLAEGFRNDPRYTVYDISTEIADLTILPNEHPFLKDVAVRQALALAVNRAEMITGILDDQGEPAAGPMRPEHWAYNRDVTSVFDPERAKTMLDQAGWKDTNGDGVREKDGVRAGFTIMYLANQAEHKDMALALRSDLAKIGVDVEVDGVQSPGYEARLKTDAWLHNLGQPYDPDLDLWIRFHSRFATDDEPTTNMAGMKHPEVDRALEEGRATADQDRRREAYLRLQQAVADDASHLFLTRRKLHVVVPSNIEGIVPQVQASGHAYPRGISYNIEEWRWAR